MEQAPEAAPPGAAPEAAPPDTRDLFTFISETTKEAAEAPASADAELVFVGPKNSGKSTLVQSFLQKDEPPKPSTPLEYRYARHTVGTRPAVVANVWELGGGVSSTGSHTSELVKTVLLPELMPRTVVAIVLDLSEPESAVSTLTTWLNEVRRRVDEMLQELALSAEGSAIAATARKASEKVWAEHQDAQLETPEPVQPVGVPIVIFAHKCTLTNPAATCSLQQQASPTTNASLRARRGRCANLPCISCHLALVADDAFTEAYPEVEQQKVMCRTLRFLAHNAGASLICTKHKDNTSKYLMRNLLGHHVFGNVKVDVTQMQTSHMKPLFVPATADSYKAIGNPPTVQGCLSDLMADKWRAVFEEVFPPRKKKEAQADLTMVEAEQFAEEGIDELRRQKRDELVKMRKAMEFEAKMAAEMASATAAQPTS